MLRKFYVAIILCASFSCLWWPRCRRVEISRSTASETKQGVVIETKQQATTFSSDAIVLVPGELPGYTGWSRFKRTLAGSFEITSRDDTAVVAGSEWNVTVECKEECHTLRDGNHAHFYARAYGPAVLAGSVHEISSTSYSVSFLPMDPGLYTVEAVLTSSGAPSWGDFPLEEGRDDPTYEGFLLPGFPFQFEVSRAPFVHSVNRSCVMSDLLSDTTTSAYRKARWIVVDKVSHRTHNLSSIEASPKITFDKYVSGHQSLGIFMDYRHQDCILQSFQDAIMKLANYASAHTNMRIIFVGDSTIRLQSVEFQRLIPMVPITFIATNGGIVQRMIDVTSELQEMARDSPNERRFVLFNTGLHDAEQLCSRLRRKVRRTYLKQPDATFSCTAQYRQSLGELADFVHRYPAELKIFMSSTAGWPRYGNFGFEWPHNQPQNFVASSNLMAHFNEIAYQVMHQGNRSSIRGILDGYWVTLARPDNREIGVVSNRPKHMVHPGKEVLLTMVRNWVLVLLQHLETLKE